MWLQKTEHAARFLIGSRTQWRVPIVISVAVFETARVPLKKRANGNGKYFIRYGSTSNTRQRLNCHSNVYTCCKLSFTSNTITPKLPQSIEKIGSSCNVKMPCSNSGRNISGYALSDFPWLLYTNRWINYIKLNSVAWVRERTIPTDRPPLVGEFSVNFCV
jgi:hypothetical protein